MGLLLRPVLSLKHAKTCVNMQKKTLTLKLTYWLEPTGCKGIPDVTFDARADGYMVLDRADGIDTTSSRAWVYTLVSLACFI